MYNFLLKLLGVPAEQVERISGGRLRFAGDVGFEWVVLVAILLGVFVFFMYRRAAPDLSPFRKYTMGVLRMIFLILLLVTLLRPIWELIIVSTVRRELAVLVDVSTSMKVEDPRSDSDDLKRVALARGVLDPTRGLGQQLATTSGLESVSRIDLVRTVLRSKQLDLINRLAADYNIESFTFESVFHDIAEGKFRKEPENQPATAPTGSPTLNWIDQLRPQGQQTALGDALRQVVSRKRGQPMAGIFLITDGASNSGSDPRAAAALARDARVPLFIYGVGIEKPRNLAVGNIFAPEVSFVKDEVPVTVRIKTQAVKSAKLTLKLVDVAGREEKVDEKSLDFDTDAEPAISLKFSPKLKGDYTLKAVIETADGSIELTRDDNEASQPLRVIDSKIKVLLADNQPRWEFKYLMAMLMRDRRIEAKVVLMEGAGGLARKPESPYLEKFPDDKRELFKYDLVIFGDIDPAALGKERMDAIEEFVTKFGGGLAVVAGKKNIPWNIRRTPLEKMLPVELEVGMAAPGAGADDVFDKPVRLELTAAGKRTPMLRLNVDDKVSEIMWSKLPPIYWVAPVARPKPAAEVLLVDPSSARSSRFGKMPVVAVQQYGMGQVMWIGSDNTWRWRRNKGDEQYITLWGQVVQRLAMPHLLGASKRTQLTLDKKEYVTNEKVNLFARLYTEAYAPITAEKVKAFVSETGPDDPRAREIVLRPLPQQPGMYRGEFNAPEKPGIFRIFVDIDKQTIIDLPVGEPKMEPGDNALQREALEALAKSTGGRFVREEDLHSLPDHIRQESPKVVSRIEVEFWTSPLYYILMLCFVTGEWVMRKASQLK